MAAEGRGKNLCYKARPPARSGLIDMAWLLLMFAATRVAALSLDMPNLFGVAPSLQGITTTLKIVSAESVNAARAATAPVIEVVNSTASEARKALGDLSMEFAKSVLKARAMGWDAAHCAQAKQLEAEQAIREATAKLDNCAALAAIEANTPMQSIENLTEEAIKRIDNMAGEVADCVGGINTLSCLLNLVRTVMDDVGDLTRVIAKQALGAGQSVANVARYAMQCASNQVSGATSYLKTLDITSCTQQ